MTESAADRRLAEPSPASEPAVASEAAPASASPTEEGIAARAATAVEGEEDAEPARGLLDRLAELRRGRIEGWEEAASRARRLLGVAAAPVEGEEEPETVWTRLRERGQTVLQARTLARAQDRGADLLLDVLTRARRSLEAAERGLKALRERQQGEGAAADADAGTPAAA